MNQAQQQAIYTQWFGLYLNSTKNGAVADAYARHRVRQAVDAFNQNELARYRARLIGLPGPLSFFSMFTESGRKNLAQTQTQPPQPIPYYF